MDHHCPWIYNCVGFKNHKYFYLLLVYSCAACHYITWTMLESVTDSVGQTLPFTSMFVLLFGETLAAFLGILVTGFLAFHTWLVLKGMTTIEFCEKRKAAARGSRSSYDRGFVGNVRAVLGDSPLLWFLPVSPPSGRGLYFAEEDYLLGRDLEGPVVTKHRAGNPRSQRAEGEPGENAAGSFAYGAADEGPLRPPLQWTRPLRQAKDAICP